MNILQPQKGKLLIAEPAILNDDSFNRSIILLTEHTSTNAIGFIINKPLGYTVNDLIPEIDNDFTIYQGGPVEQDNLYFVHNVPDKIPNSIEVSNGVYWGGNFDSLKQLLDTKEIQADEIRFFLGYTGWSSDQLKDEIATNSWFISENSYSNIFTVDEKKAWKNKLLERGGDYAIWANAPENIQLN
ncbi:transcriptional regulator [Polaribacter pacificus]|uniref:UPF0301 protein GCM10011416_23160 n=1 Tax=Polaribacter pacificus TaxID=1775173 RepID=A0A917MFP0_9FLAO|nr:YqgE/AlgH family protein [Polaribacter pacificus]GGH03567.1 transcriptional regulator [Polaribacter pacificus]